jgi:hypothetical protein
LIAFTDIEKYYPYAVQKAVELLLSKENKLFKKEDVPKLLQKMVIFGKARTL